MRLRDLREDHDLTQKQVADYLYVRCGTYSKYERGINQIPLELIIRLARYYGVSTDYILGLTNISAPYPPKTKKL